MIGREGERRGRETDLALAEGREGDIVDDGVATRVDDGDRVGVAGGDVELRARLIPHERGRVPSDGNVDNGVAREIDSSHAPGFGDPARVDAHRLGPYVAALFCRALRGRGLGSAEYGDVGDARVGGNDGGDRFDAERDLADQSSGIGVDDGERVVGGEREDGEPLGVWSRLSRDRWCSGHEIAERAGVGGCCDRVAGCVAVEDLELSDRRAAPRVGSGGKESADGGRKDAMCYGIDRQREDAWASVDAGARDDSIVAPRDVLDGAGDGDDDVLRGCAEPDTADLSGENGLDAGGGDALAGGDDAGVGDGARGGLCRRQQKRGK